MNAESVGAASRSQRTYGRGQKRNGPGTILSDMAVAGQMEPRRWVESKCDPMTPASDDKATQLRRIPDGEPINP